MKSIWLKLLLCLVLCCVHQLGSAKDVRLITIGSGSAFWSAFGHTALSVDADVYGFGYFSFTDDVIMAFIQNRMMYDLGVSEINHEFQLARRADRGFRIQTLELTASQALQVERALEDHYLPENRQYQYDYFVNNCATKIRDVLNTTMNNALFEQGQEITEKRYADFTMPLNDQAWMNLGLALGYGWPAYQKRNAWELMAFPEYFSHFLEAQFPTLVKNTDVPFEPEPVSGWQVVLKAHAAVLLLVVVGLVLLAWPFSRLMAAQLNMWLQSVIGLVLLGLWLFTPHMVADWNFNVLLFFPLAVLALWHRFLQRVMMAALFLWVIVAVWLGAYFLMPLVLVHGLSVWVLWRSGQSSNSLTSA